MILAKGSHEEGDSLILGISKENLRRLTSGQPIHFLLADRIGALAAESLTNPTITILYGETENEIAAKFLDELTRLTDHTITLGAETLRAMLSALGDDE